MGLDATVMCTCFQEGKAEPAFPREWLVVDEEGYLNLTPEQDNPRNNSLLNHFLETGCPHARMEYASERISNWSGYRSFQGVLRTLGMEKFPVLQQELPMNNGGITLSEQCTVALEELDRFMSFPRTTSTPALYEGETGKLLYKYIEDYEGVFIWSGSDQSEMGVDHDGFFVRDREGNILFRSQRFLQHHRSKRDWFFRKRILYTWNDLDTGKAYTTSTPLKYMSGEGQTNSEKPFEYYTGEAEETPDDFDYAVEPLRIVFKAALVTGNPVRWC
ncbi:MAG: hypothetical protein KDA65_15620 [Planctomycetaceae bacterium]|nr:hypothetical protein [Planctomycetaceae bacterium]